MHNELYIFISLMYIKHQEIFKNKISKKESTYEKAVQKNTLFTIQHGFHPRVCLNAVGTCLSGYRIPLGKILH